MRLSRLGGAVPGICPMFSQMQQYLLSVFSLVALWSAVVFSYFLRTSIIIFLFVYSLFDADFSDFARSSAFYKLVLKCSAFYKMRFIFYGILHKLV